MRSGTNATPWQKNGVVVRQVVGGWGHGRLIGGHASLQLDELYRALHWYVNCFQPSMKLVAKQVEGRTIHRSLRRGQNAAATGPVLWSAVHYPATGTACYRESA